MAMVCSKWALARPSWVDWVSGLAWPAPFSAHIDHRFDGNDQGWLEAEIAHPLELRAAKIGNLWLLVHFAPMP